ncbi:hypothetical protein N7448_000110 [Penicillium atrosanguineum]|uniref:NmrA-like domain-containing protein n=1 Tax=Penicillium atrosanguineum TaxID=1132637 RepID=A0A9W9HHK1_9EURO|nr:uncharacterized protein N7443_003511 [Penicillium atrosanguineum]KAJ5134867.1 hypothetical protein N7526_006232 [Penicillium atrosanguineum]KAJ5148532.1 hypothetical protein N7448_000110 [Penicillium atrosanguineum]KAJ5303851.1 hypothetical protein N7443_003511 [Penicillium atrosanguineum]KAJ5323326.1 hypothetical protein N7476_001926 [Penicillium atrosanguineum]
MTPKTITVFGATGNQGGSVLRSLLQNSNFAARGITRNPQSNASMALAARGVEMIQADGFNSEEMITAFHGSWGAFVNINSDDKIFANTKGPTEFDMGKTIVDAAAHAGVQHFVFSSGPPCTEMTGGLVQMKAMDMKYKIEKYARDLRAFKSVNPIGAGWFLENFLGKEAAPVFGGFPHFPDEEGFLTFRVPYWGGEENVPWLSISDDFGDIVQGIFLDPMRWDGHFVHGVSHICSFDRVVADFQDVSGQKSRFVPILPSWEAFDTHGIHELEDVKLMFGFTQITDGKYFADPTECHTASELKKTTAMALGWSESRYELVTAREWFSVRFEK